MVKKINPAELQKIVSSVPMISASASRLLQITSQPDHEIMDVVNLVKTDANLTARILKVVNSAAYGLVNQITSVDRAVSYLGQQVIVSIAIESCAGELFAKELSGYEAVGGDLWKHDLRTAIAAREVVIQSGADLSPDLAFTAGLLHDIGKALISDYLRGSAPDAVELISSHDSLDYLAAEEHLVGVDHTIAGEALAMAWQLPPELITVIRHHHQPALAEEAWRPLVYAVHLGDSIAMMGGFGTGSDSMRYKLDPHYADFFPINATILANVMLVVDTEFNKLSESLSDTGEKS